jgi:hypothetical protein
VHTYDEVTQQLKIAVPHCTDAIATSFAVKIDGARAHMCAPALLHRRVAGLPCGVAVVRVGTRAECEATCGILRSINLGADVRPVRTQAAQLDTTTPLDDAWTLVPPSAVEQLMTLVRDVAVDGGLARLFADRLIAPLPVDVDGSSSNVDPTFAVAGHVEIDAADALTPDAERGAFVRKLAAALELPETHVTTQCRVSMWRDPSDGQFRARIAAPAALNMGASLDARARVCVSVCVSVCAR